MAGEVHSWMRPFLTGKCFDFALALAERVENPQFVAVGSVSYPDHVALRIGDRYADVRGVLGVDDFLAHHAGSDIIDIDRVDVEFQCGLADVKPPYRGNADIREARKAVDKAIALGVIKLDDLVPAEAPAP